MDQIEQTEKKGRRVKNSWFQGIIYGFLIYVFVLLYVYDLCFMFLIYDFHSNV